MTAGVAVGGNTITDLLAAYQAHGLKLVYWERVGNDPKDWKGPRDKGWNDPTKEYPLEKYDPATMNLGTLTGYEIEPQKFVVDIDFDWSDGLNLARHIIPSTGFIFGRKGKKISHALFTTPDQLGITTYYDISDEGSGNGEMFVELRGGDMSHQTMIAPSLHSPDTFIELVINGQILHVETKAIQQATLDYAIGCLLLKRIPGGLHHDGRKPLAGFLLRAGLSPERVTAIGEAVCQVQVENGVPDMSGKDVSDMGLVVRTTVRALEQNKRADGGPKLAQFIGPRGRAVLELVNTWLGRDQDFIRNKEGVIVKDSQENIERAVRLLDVELSYDVFSEQTFITSEGQRRPLDDAAMDALWFRIDREHRFRPTPAFYEKKIKDLARENECHPVREYLRSLTWDGVPRINTWLHTYGGVEDVGKIHASESDDGLSYLEAVSSIVLIAAVRRVMHPGEKYDEMMVWESEQGLNKSTALRALCPNGDWFSDDLPLNVDSKQVIERTIGKWIIESADLTGGRKADRDHLKSMLSRQTDGPCRMAYAHQPISRDRQFIIVGTTNNKKYLEDSTGARRFWPVAVKNFNIEAIVRDRDLLWSEAVHREALGESIRLPECLWADAGYEQEQRRAADPWEQMIEDYLATVAPCGNGLKQVTTDSIFTILGFADGSRRDRHGEMRISETMQKLGYENRKLWDADAKKMTSGYRELKPSAPPAFGTLPKDLKI